MNSKYGKSWKPFFCDRHFTYYWCTVKLVTIAFLLSTD